MFSIAYGYINTTLILCFNRDETEVFVGVCSERAFQHPRSRLMCDRFALDPIPHSLSSGDLL